MCCIRRIRPWQPGWNANHATGWQIGGKLAFHLNYRLDRGALCILRPMSGGTFPGYFSSAFLTLIGLEAYPCDPAGSTCHNKSENMTEMFSLAWPMSVKHQCGGSPPLMILLHLFPENVALLQAHSLPCCSSDRGCKLGHAPTWSGCIILRPCETYRFDWYVKYRCFNQEYNPI